ncbi:MAG: hypothetical protein ACE5RP_08445, partial [Nitrosopumilus sp.]
MGEFQEFAEALFGQLSVEINEEKEITELAAKAKEDISDKVKFKELDDKIKQNKATLINIKLKKREEKAKELKKNLEKSESN